MTSGIAFAWTMYTPGDYFNLTTLGINFTFMEVYLNTLTNTNLENEALTWPHVPSFLVGDFYNFNPGTHLGIADSYPIYTAIDDACVLGLAPTSTLDDNLHEINAKLNEVTISNVVTVVNDTVGWNLIGNSLDITHDLMAISNGATVEFVLLCATIVWTRVPEEVTFLGMAIQYKKADATWETLDRTVRFVEYFESSGYSSRTMHAKFLLDHEFHEAANSRGWRLVAARRTSDTAKNPWVASAELSVLPFYAEMV